MQLSEYQSEWDKAWKSMRKRFVRIETYQDYTAQEKSQSLHLHKRNVPKSLELAVQDQESWTKACKEAIKKGINLYRIHYIEQPITQYIFWELDVYKHINIRLNGEQVFGITEPKPSWATSDYTLFDDIILKTTYSDMGVLLTAEFVEDANVLEQINQLIAELTRPPTPEEIEEQLKINPPKKAKQKIKKNTPKKNHKTIKSSKKGNNW
jgi:hypothetical protein